MSAEDMYYTLFDIKQTLQEIAYRLNEKEYLSNEEEQTLKDICTAEYQLDSISDLIEWLDDLGLVKGDVA